MLGSPRVAVAGTTRVSEEAGRDGNSAARRTIMSLVIPANQYCLSPLRIVFSSYLYDVMIAK